MDGRSPRSQLTYAEATQWLFDRIDYERTRPDPGDSNPFRLERTQQLLQLIGTPQNRIPCVHIAGTKGKGSTAAMLESILRAGGLRTGLFTSPHIDTVEERMQINGEIPQPARFTSLINQLIDILHTSSTSGSEHIPTFFETTTLLAWMLFDQESVDLVVLETGLGGRLDCTNVCSPLVTVITSIGLDHTHILGDTLGEIAAEKAGILKPDVPAVIGHLPPEASEVVLATAKHVGCPVHVADQHFRAARSTPDASACAAEVFGFESNQLALPGLTIPLRGAHQVDNAALAIEAAMLLKHHFPQLNATHVRAGLANVQWSLRFEVLQSDPIIIVDAAHNPDSCEVLVQTLNESIQQAGQRVLIFGVSADKDASAMLKILLPHFDRAVFTRFTGNPRGVAPERVQQLAADAHPSRMRDVIATTPATAVEATLQSISACDTVVVTGSLFLAAEVRSILKPGNIETELSSGV